MDQFEKTYKIYKGNKLMKTFPNERNEIKVFKYVTDNFKKVDDVRIITERKDDEYEQ